MSTAVYLIQASLCLGVFYLVYRFCFRGNTFFTANRVYLLAGLVLSFVIPVLEIPVLPSIPTTIQSSVAEQLLPASDHLDTSFGDSSATSVNFDYSILLWIAYGLGCCVLTTRFGASIYRIIRMKRAAVRRHQVNSILTHPDVKEPFTCFNLIFLPTHDVDAMVIQHEMVHVRQFHWIDVIIMEVAAIVLWFNPFVFWYRNAIKLHHEFLADTAVASTEEQTVFYLRCLMRQVETAIMRGPISTYSHAIKTRIHMITCKPTSRRFFALYLLALPVVGLLLFAFASVPAVSQSGPHSGRATIIIDAGHGGSDHGSAVGDLTEKVLTLAIVQKLQRTVADKGIEVILTRSADESMQLKERVALAGKSSAKLFISLHVNADHKNPAKSGIDCMVSEHNAQFDQSRLFANYVVAELNGMRGIRINGVKRSNAYVLKNNSIAAIAIELGYLTNPKDNAFIRQEENQNAIAEKIAAALVQFLK